MRWFVLAGLVLTFLTTFVGFLQSRRNAAKISEVHVLVNSQLHAVLDRVEQLKGTLVGAGIDVPDDPRGHNPVG